MECAAEELPRSRTALPDLQGQAEGVDGHVGPALVDDSDHAEGHPLLAQLQAVGHRAAAQHLADRVGQAGDLTQPGGDAVDALRVQRQPVQHSLGGACRAGGLEILGVGGQDLVGVGQYGVGRRVQRSVLDGGGQRSQRARGEAGAPGRIVNLSANIGDRRRLDTH